MPETPDPEADPSLKNRKRLVVSEDLPLTMLTAVSATIVMSLLDLGRQYMLLGVALSPFVADVIKNAVAARGWGKRRLIGLTALLVLLGSVRDALAAPVRRRRQPRAPGRQVAAPAGLRAVAVTALVSSVVTVGLFTVPEVARGKGLLVERSTTFFGGESKRDWLPPRLTVPSDRVVYSSGPARVSFRATASDLVDGPLTPKCSPASGSLFDFGTTTVSCSAEDRNGLRVTRTFEITVRQGGRLTITVPAPLRVEAQGPGGSRVLFEASARDPRQGPRPVRCEPRSGSLFPMGQTTVTCRATDAEGKNVAGRFLVSVQDSSAPALQLPDRLVVKTSRDAEKRIEFQAGARDRVDGTVAIECHPSSGSLFAVGSTTVRCSSTDSRGNRADGRFVVTLDVAHSDRAPHLALRDLRAEATSLRGAAVKFRATATDDIDGDIPAACTPRAGSTFAFGTTIVRCRATDSAGQSTTSSFTVTVSDTTPPSLKLPVNANAEATSSRGATVTYDAVALDAVDGHFTPKCSAASGATFALGSTTVSCSAVDRHGNKAAGSFTVTVVDTTPPELRLPADIKVEATSSKGAFVRYSVSAVDAVDGRRLPSCSLRSPSIFPFGVTTVTCSVTDRHGNRATGRFTVSISDTTPPRLTLPSDLTLTATFDRRRNVWGAIASYAVSAFDTVDGRRTPTCVPPSGTFLTVKAGASSAVWRIRCSVTDTHGNTASGGFTVTVQVPQVE